MRPECVNSSVARLRAWLGCCRRSCCRVAGRSAVCFGGCYESEHPMGDRGSNLMHPVRDHVPNRSKVCLGGRPQSRAKSGSLSAVPHHEDHVHQCPSSARGRPRAHLITQGVFVFGAGSPRRPSVQPSRGLGVHVATPKSPGRSSAACLSCMPG